MMIEYETPRIEKSYDIKTVKKQYGTVFAIGLEKMINFILAANNAYDVKMRPQFHMHLLKGDLYGIYSLSPDNKKSKYRVPAICKDECGVVLTSFENEYLLLINSKIFLLKGIMDYHD